MEKTALFNLHKIHARVDNDEEIIKTLCRLAMLKKGFDATLICAETLDTPNEDAFEKIMEKIFSRNAIYICILTFDRILGEIDWHESPKSSSEMEIGEAEVHLHEVVLWLNNLENHIWNK